MSKKAGFPLRNAVAAGVLLVLAWIVCASFLVERNYLARVDALVAAQDEVAEVRARDLAGSIQRNLHYMRGIPEVMAQAREVVDALRRLAAEGPRSGEAWEQKATRWKADAPLRQLDRFLAKAQDSLDIDILYVADAAGNVVAASDSGRAGQSVGTNVADRSYFHSALGGGNGVQYAVGKATGIPGLFFSAPVVAQGRVLGVVIAKVHMPNLSFLLDQSDSFLSDASGVVIMAHNRALEMTVLPGAPIEAVSEAERMTRYRRTKFPVLPVVPWEHGGRRKLYALAGGRVPGVLAASALPEYGIEAHVFSEITPIPELRDDQFWFALLVALAGSLVIVLLEAGVLYLRAVMRAKARLWEKAHHDGLTGLANRELFRRRLVQSAERARRQGRPMALLLGDLDGFKKVNDTLGHGAGDQILQHTARRIASCVRASDTVARLGGDEFTVLLADVGSEQRAREVAAQIVARIAGPFHLRDDLTAHLSISLGVAVLPDDAADVDTLLTRADQAMYLAKRQGGNRNARLAPGKGSMVAESDLQEPAARTA